MTANPATASLEAEIRSYVAMGSGLPSHLVIPGNDHGPAPQELYASVMLIHQDIRGIPVNQFDGEAEIRTLATVRGRYSVQWFRDGAREAVVRFAVWTSSPEGLQAAGSRGFTVHLVSDIRQLDELVSESWEERSGIDIDIGFLYSLEHSVDSFGAVGVELGVDSGIHLIEVGK